MLKALDESGLAPEQLAPLIGVSNMTLRRWRLLPKNRKVPPIYEKAVVEALYQLLLDNRLQADSPSVQRLIRESTSQSFAAAIHSLGVAETLAAKGQSDQDRIMFALSHIGHDEDHRRQVDASNPKIEGLKEMGDEWRSRISALLSVVRSKRLVALDKLIAYGALFYLIYPFDLIPDYIPVVGHLDDFAMLGFAVAYYVRKHPDLIEPKSERGAK